MKQPRETTYSVSLTEIEICQALACIATAADLHKKTMSPGISTAQSLETLGNEIWLQLRDAKVTETSTMTHPKMRLRLVR